MTPYQRLVANTQSQQDYLLSAPILTDVTNGDINLAMYIQFLTNAYHHVRFTVPLMMATGARLAPNHSDRLDALQEYVNEEIGHEKWILNDLEACGVDPKSIQNSQPNLATEVLVAYVRDYINTVDANGFFGMVHVLEGTSTALASNAADLIQNQLELPDTAFTYLRSHGALDIAHVAFFQDLLNDFEDHSLQHVMHVAGRAYHLYGDVLRSVGRLEQSLEVAQLEQETQHVA